MDNILQFVDFRTLLAFRGTNKEYRKKIDVALEHLVVLELLGGPPLHEMIIQVKTATGYSVLECPSHMCIQGCTDKRKHP